MARTTGRTKCLLGKTCLIVNGKSVKLLTDAQSVARIHRLIRGLKLTTSSGVWDDAIATRIYGLCALIFRDEDATTGSTKSAPQKQKARHGWARLIAKENGL